MNPIAVYSGSIVIYWSAVILTLGVIAGFFLSLSLYTSDGGSAAAMWVLLPLATLFSVFLCRVIHWYCHLEQYESFFRAMTDFSVGSYCLPGMLLGVALAAWLVKKLGLAKSTAKLLDALAPGEALCIAMIRLSALFNSSCRSKIIVTNPALQHLPLASELTSASGVVEYRFATFFVQFLFMLVITGLLVGFWAKRRNAPMLGREKRQGHTARLFLVLYSAPELLFDSTRYDSSFFHFTFLKQLNPYAGFVSLIQVIAAVTVLCVLIHYSKASVRARGLRLFHGLMWLLFAAAVAAVGASEYLVQRHGDWYMRCYAAMGAGCIAMIVSVWAMYLSCRDREAWE